MRRSILGFSSLGVELLPFPFSLFCLSTLPFFHRFFFFILLDSVSGYLLFSKLLISLSCLNPSPF